jgi:MFS family permease
MLLEIPFLLLIPTMCYSGLSQGFIYSAIPPLITDNSRKFLMFTLFGIINASSSIFFGKLSDYLGRRLLVFTIGTLVHMTIYGLLSIIWKPPLDENRIEIFIIMIICLSMGDAIFTTQLYAILAILYGDTRPAEAFACFRVFQASCTAIVFVGQVYFPFSVHILYLIIVLSLSLITLIYEHYGIASLDTGKMIISIQKPNKNKMETKADVQIPLTTLPDIA